MHDVERFLRGDRTAAPDLDTLLALSLSGHAYATLPQHPQRATLKRAFFHTAARHLAVRQAIAALLRAWAEADVRPVVFKGFYLAEFVYRSAGQRAYADVDVVIEEWRASDAIALAQPLGWEIVWRVDLAEDVLAVHGAEYTGHEVGQIRHPELDLAIDIHRRAVHNSHNRLPAHPAAARLTAALSDGADDIEWEGVTVRIPNPVDAVVFGLALNRCWGSDGWQVKPRDYADFEALVARFGITTSAVLARARDIGVHRTVVRYLERCDPNERRLVLQRPSWWTLRRWNLEATPERGAHDVVNAWMSLVNGVVDFVALLQMTPVVLRARRTARTDRRPPPVVAPATNGRRLSTWRWRTYRRAIERVVKLWRTPSELAASVAAFAGLEVMLGHGLDASVERVASAGGESQRVRLRLGERVVPFAFDAYDERPHGDDHGTRHTMRASASRAADDGASRSATDRPSS